MRQKFLVSLVVFIFVSLCAVGMYAYANTTGENLEKLKETIEAGEEEIALTGNIDVDQHLEIGSGKKITIDLNGHNINFNNNSNQDSVIVVNGGNLTITDTSSQGIGKITGGHANNGGGICVINNGNFTMENGEISGNTAEKGGGVYSDSSSMFTMQGGSIVENTANNNGGGVYVDSESTFKMQNGNIGDNKAQKGGGVYINKNGSFTLEGGTIDENEASNNGGGVYVLGNGAFTMEDGKIIGNIAKSGGGVRVKGNGSTFSMLGGDILQNIATKNGGGVCIKNDGAFIIEGGRIAQNIANKNGGGVHIKNNSTFTNKGGTISENTSKKNSGGVYFKNSKYELSGDAEIQNNEGADIYVPSANLITLTSELNKDQKIKITTDSFIIKQNIIKFATGSGAIDSNADKFQYYSNPTYYKSAQVSDNVDNYLQFEYTKESILDNEDLDTEEEILEPTEEALEIGNLDENKEVAVYHELKEAIEKGYKNIVLSDNISLDAHIEFGSDQETTIDLNGFDIDRGLSSNARMKDTVFEVLGGKLTIKDTSDEKYGKITGSNNLACIVVQDGGTLDMQGVNIQGNDSNGVYIDNGIFTMEDSTIKDNEEGVIINDKQSIFTMKSGYITENKKDGITNYGTFTMKSGYITGNKKCGVTNHGTFTMEDGSVNDNNITTNNINEPCACGVTNHKDFTMKNGTISGNSYRYRYGVVFNRGTFTMEDGTISNNSGDTELNYGHVVYNDSNANFTMKNGCIDTDNSNECLYISSSSTATIENGTLRGGTNGVEVLGSFILKDGLITGDNKFKGRAVLVKGDGSFVFEGGSICEHEHGVYVRDQGSVTMGNGTIYDNDCGIYFAGKDFNLYSDVKFQDNKQKDVHLVGNNSYINIKNKLNKDTKLKIEKNGIISGIFKSKSIKFAKLDEGIEVTDDQTNIFEYVNYPSEYKVTQMYEFDENYLQFELIKDSNSEEQDKDKIQKIVYAKNMDDLNKAYRNGVDKIVLKRNIYSTEHPSLKDCTLDLHGHYLKLQRETHYWEYANGPGGFKIRVRRTAYHKGAVQVSGAVTITDESLFKNGKITNYNWAGILVDSNSMLIMKGGSVTKNSDDNKKAGGIYIGKNSSVELQGVTISKNKGAAADVYVNTGSILKMKDTTISGFLLDEDEACSQGVYVESSTFIMESGEISRQRFLGIRAIDSTVQIKGGTIYKSKHGNQAIDSDGSSKFYFSKGAKITGSISPKSLEDDYKNRQ